jgi:phosphatidylserine/phosphatidylglycerophosphate/cardiolipin synthase-like enzyme
VVVTPAARGYTGRMRAILFPALLSLALLGGPACTPPAAPAPAPSGDVALVESVPIETSLDHPDIPDAFQVWPEMIRGATRSLDVAQFYVSNEPGSRLEPVIQAVEAAADRGVAVRILADAFFAKKYPETLDRLAARKGIVVRRFDVGKVMGGVLHAKYFVVDGREAYVGSQNFDWRSLTHIQEMGVRVRDPGAATTYARVFAMDWALAAGETPPLSGTEALAGAPPSFAETASGGPARVTPVASPRGFLPDPRSWELPRIIALIDGAARSVHVQVLTYGTHARDGSPFPDLDDALRRAAARGVDVRLLVADWSKRKGTVEAVQKLARVPGMSVRFIDVPAWSGGFVPFARVAHAKYMVVDGARAWVGTSNWEADYFTRSRNVGLVVEGDAFAAQLEHVFHDGFDGAYAEKVDPDRTYEPPRTDDKPPAPRAPSP